jgi:hypothetical protein
VSTQPEPTRSIHRHRLATFGFWRHRPEERARADHHHDANAYRLIVLGLVAKIVFGPVETAGARREGAAAVGPDSPDRDDTAQPGAAADGHRPAQAG